MGLEFKSLFKFDSFRSLLTGLGVPGRDRVTSLGPSPDTITYNMRDLENLYRGNWIAKKIVDIPAFDCTRSWRTWDGDQDQVSQLEDAEKLFGLQRKMLDAMIKSRLYGGAAMLMGIKGQKFNEELDLDSVGEGDLKFVHVVEKWMIQAGPRVRDITSPWFGEPSYYMRSNIPIISAPGNVDPLESSSLGYNPGDTIFIHPSRVVRMVGIEYPDMEHSPDAWGDSVLASIYEAIRDAGLVTQSLANMIADAKVDVFKIPGLTSTLSTQAGTDKMISYFANANVAKSVVNSLVIDKEIDWERIQTKFEGLPEVLQAYLLICSAGADIPSTRMLSREPSGQNATGESDTRNYYDRLSSEQAVILTPTLSRLDEVLIRSTLGDRPKELKYDWNPLWQMADTEKATIALQKAQAYKIDVDTALIPAEALVIGRQNQLIEDGVYPGLETALDDLDQNWNEEAEFLPLQAMENSNQQQEQQRGSAEKIAKMTPPPQIAGPGGPTKPAASAKPGDKMFRDAKARLKYLRDAKPRTLYVRRDVLNADDIIEWAKDNGFTDTLDADDMHVTIAYSNNPVNWMAAPEVYDYDGQLKISSSGVRMIELFGPNKDCAVLLFNSGALTRRHDELGSIGATWDWDEYQPHITISYDVPPDLDITQIEPYNGVIILGPEIFETVKSSSGVSDDSGQSALGFSVSQATSVEGGRKRKAPFVVSPGPGHPDPDINYGPNADLPRDGHENDIFEEGVVADAFDPDQERDEHGRFGTGAKQGSSFPHTITVEHHPETGSKKPHEVWNNYHSGRRRITGSFKTREGAIASVEKKISILRSAVKNEKLTDAFDPDQERDYHGRFGSGGSSEHEEPAGGSKPDIMFYHGTARSLISSIKTHGLIPPSLQEQELGAKTKGGDAWAKKHNLQVAKFAIGSRAASVYITTNPQTAVQFAETAAEMNETEPVILKIRIPQARINDIFEDEFAPEMSAYRFKGKITPNMIEAVHLVGGKVKPLSAVDAQHGDVVLYGVIFVKPPMADGYDPDEERDENGRWGSGGESAEAKAKKEGDDRVPIKIPVSEYKNKIIGLESFYEDKKPGKIQQVNVSALRATQDSVSVNYKPEHGAANKDFPEGIEYKGLVHITDGHHRLNYHISQKDHSQFVTVRVRNHDAKNEAAYKVWQKNTFGDAEWTEELHPRGGATNPGQFAAGGGGESKIASREYQTKAMDGAVSYLRQAASISTPVDGVDSKSSFLLKNGTPYMANAKTFAGKRDAIGLCYMNATKDALYKSDRTYVEGIVMVSGVPIDHAWTVDSKGQIYDSTIRPDAKVGGYYGVPFTKDYLRNAMQKNGYYGLLGSESRKTRVNLFSGKAKGYKELADPDKLNDDVISDRLSFADRMLSSIPVTDGIHSADRLQLRDNIVSALYNKDLNKRTHNKTATIVLGLPGSGKSTISNPLVKEGRLEIEGDNAKAMLPEFAGGVGAYAVHEESSAIMRRVLAKAMAAGDDIVWPRIDSQDKIVKDIQSLHDAGYEVNVKFVDVPVPVAIHSAIARFIKMGRYVSPEMITRYGDSPRASYLAAVSTGLLKSHERFKRGSSKGFVKVED